MNFGSKYDEHLVYLLDTVHAQLLRLESTLQQTQRYQLVQKEVLIGTRIELRSCKSRLDELIHEASTNTKIQARVNELVTRYDQIMIQFKQLEQRQLMPSTEAFSAW